MWHFFNAPVFSADELTVSFAATLVSEDGRLGDAPTLERLDAYLGKLAAWVIQCRR
jgi:hypothetical protein